jgi:hypothetical protein
MAIAKLIDFVVKEVEVEELRKILFIKIVQNSEVHPRIDDPEAARFWEAKLRSEIIMNHYDRYDFNVGGETEYFYFCFHDVMKLDKIIEDIFNQRLAMEMENLKDEIRKLEWCLDNAKKTIGFYEGLPVIRLSRFVGRRLEVIKKWSLSLVRKLGIS